ncbi:MAG: ATP-binding protein [Rhodoferax sp.]|uniref:PAS domain-containing hybrid sensor histidine kinase/response regulator n=1 Tax=Rhodoferax sp. TaxID=50421 RepID=UPI0026103718|nr:ATP-binding protein [Rhodoferax sp.]MDD5333967.1 ATP-binding protein [Rhodoferax sp.]
MNSIMRWLAPPVFAGDEEKTRQASLINVICVASLVFIWVLVAGSLLTGNIPTTILIIELFSGSAVILQLLRWLRIGKVTLARAGIIIFGLVYITGATASIGTIRTPTAAVFVFWVLMTGLLFGLRGILIGTPTASLAVSGLIVAQNAGWLRQPFQGVGLMQWLTFTALFGFTSGVTYYVSLGTRRALSRAEQEIERRRQVEVALKDSEQRYRTLVEWTPEPLVVHRDRKILYVNPAAVTLFGAGSAQDLVGGSIVERIAPDCLTEALAREQYFIEHGFVPRGEQKFCKMDKTTIDVEVQSSSISYDGAPAVHLAVRDITQRKAIEAVLEAARLRAENSSQAKSRFLASASHDLRQPAHALGLFVARLAELPNDAQTRHLVDCMDASVRAMQDMLDGFFDISRLESEQTQIKKVGFPIQAVFGQLGNGFASAASDKGLRLRFRPSTAWVESDPGLLHRILLNLVSNAVRYTRQGSVLVACRPTSDGTRLRIEVRDSGVGIAAQHHENIFQEFFQIDNLQRDRSKGLGVGLSIVDRACRLLDHPLVMHSAPGCGTRFTLTVPMAPAQAGRKHEQTTEVATSVEFDGLCVLLIEDDALGRVGLASLLESWGCTVLAAEGAQAGCKLYRPDQSPDIIISDFRLGGGVNGIEAVDMLSAAAGRRIAACLVSGDTDASVRQKAQAAGLTLLQKPVRPAKLRSLVRHLAKTK